MMMGNMGSGGGMDMMGMSGSGMGTMQSMGSMDPMSMGAGMNMPMYGTMNSMGSMDPSMMYGNGAMMGTYGTTGAGFLAVLLAFAVKIFVILLVIGLFAGLVIWAKKYFLDNQPLAFSGNKVCPSCKGQVQADFSFCPNCQAALKNVPQAPASVKLEPELTS